MSLDAETLDPAYRAQTSLPLKSAANAAAAGPDEREIIDNESVNEEAIKETPPRSCARTRKSSEPRSLDEVMDEAERQSQNGSPTLRRPKGRLEARPTGETYADAVSQTPAAQNELPSVPPGAWLAQKRKVVGNESASTHANGVGAHVNGSTVPEAYEAFGSDDTPRSPTRRNQKKQSSRDLSGSPMGKVAAGAASQSTEADMAPAGNVVYENLRNKSGENLASIMPDPQLYDLALAQRADKESGDQTAKKRRNNNELVSGRRAGAGWQSSAIRWAPLNVPLQRRLQTALVLLHTLSIAGCFALFFLLCTIPLLWPILLPYLLYVLFSNAHLSGELSHRSQRLKSLKVWSLFASYFPARLHRSAELEPTRKYIFGYHPHGIISHGAFAAFATEALGFSQLFPGITNTLLTLDSNFRIPIYRDYALRMGLASVSRESCENILSKGGPNGEGMGRAITIVVGGARESLDAKPGTLKLVLKRRKGFVKLAIRSGADLVPVLAFGENDLYEQLDTEQHPWVHRFQLGVKKVMGFTVPLFHARGVFNYDVGLMPYRRPVDIVVGKPIRVLQSSKPDASYVDTIHQQYCDELMRLWDDWKDTFASKREGEVQIVE